MWPLPYGVSYNSIWSWTRKRSWSTRWMCVIPIFSWKKWRMLSTGVLLVFLIVSHMSRIMRAVSVCCAQYPDVQIIGNKQTFGMLNGYHGISTGLYEVKETPECGPSPTVFLYGSDGALAGSDGHDSTWQNPVLCRCLRYLRNVGWRCDRLWNECGTLWEEMLRYYSIYCR